jgi:hypothetical protein
MEQQNKTLTSGLGFMKHANESALLYAMYGTDISPTFTNARHCYLT